MMITLHNYACSGCLIYTIFISLFLLLLPSWSIGPKFPKLDVTDLSGYIFTYTIKHVFLDKSKTCDVLLWSQLIDACPGLTICMCSLPPRQLNPTGGSRTKKVATKNWWALAAMSESRQADKITLESSDYFFDKGNILISIDTNYV
jgi:hypothetical protein